MGNVTRKIRKLTGGQAAVIIIVGLFLTRIFWADASSASYAYRLGVALRSDSAIVRQSYDQENFFESASLICGVGTVFFAFIWFGRSKDRE